MKGRAGAAGAERAIHFETVVKYAEIGGSTRIVINDLCDALILRTTSPRRIFRMEESKCEQ
jgi:hypothetical protein